jgi:stage V sporulation protein S
LVWRVERIGGPYVQVLRGFCNVDRFFSKLDLRDIKIDPFNASYPPDAEEAVEAGTEYGVETATEAEPDDQYEDEDEDVQPYANGGSVNGAVAATDGAALVEHRNGDVLKVSARSRPSAVAGAIAGVVRENGRAEVQAIGAGATNQAVKAVAIARDYLRETGIEAICLPAFIDVIIENEDRTAIRLVVEPR